jgi:Pheromone A receptor
VDVLLKTTLFFESIYGTRTSTLLPNLFPLYYRHPSCLILFSGFSGFLTSTPMSNVPAVLSFVSAVFLAVFIPVQRIRTSVPRLSIILWLLGYNLVHGINALVWSGNVGIHVPVWCDIGEILISFCCSYRIKNLSIVTNFMLGVNLALPAALLCVSRQLELLSSMRPIPSHPTVVRNQLILDIFFCYLLPVIYILLRTV